MNRIKKLTVRYHDRPVGVMALYQNRQVAFEYTKEWLSDGFSISPFSLPLVQRVFIPKVDPLKAYLECLRIVFRMAGGGCWLIGCY